MTRLTLQFRKYPEAAIATAFVALTMTASVSLDLPFSLPSGNRAAFVGVHYLYPLIGLCVWGCFAAVGQRRELISTFFVALPCYAAVLLCHFNLKLWTPDINAQLYDAQYWAIDEAMRPLVDGAIAIRRIIAPVLPLDGNFYIIAFITMFYVSFCYHALRTPEHFRSVFLAALLLQASGAIAYLLLPAIGPFLYERGIETHQTTAQMSMLGAYHAHLEGGRHWLAENGGTYLTTGLAAMPSLHAGGSFLFLYFAALYARRLLWLYIPLFTYLCVAAIAGRWHYLIDIPVGIALAWGCCLTGRWLASLRTGIPRPPLARMPHSAEGALR